MYKSQGAKAGKEAIKEGKELNNAINIFNSINDYILDGMPCDRVNEITLEEEEKVLWKRRICVHKEVWDKVGGDVSLFYELRDLWIKNFVREANSNYEYNSLGNNEFSIERL